MYNQKEVDIKMVEQLSMSQTPFLGFDCFGMDSEIVQCLLFQNLQSLQAFHNFKIKFDPFWMLKKGEILLIIVKLMMKI